MDSGHQVRLVVALRSAARELAGRRSIRGLEQTLQQIVASAVATVPAADAGSISITEHGRIATRHPTSARIRELDEMQGEVHEGPGIEALEDPPARTAPSWPATSRARTPGGGRASPRPRSRPATGSTPRPGIATRSLRSGSAKISRPRCGCPTPRAPTGRAGTSGSTTRRAATRPASGPDRRRLRRPAFARGHRGTGGEPEAGGPVSSQSGGSGSSSGSGGGEGGEEGGSGGVSGSGGGSGGGGE